MIAIAITFAVGLLVYTFLQRGADPEEAAQSQIHFDTVIEQEDSGVMRALLRLARPLGGIPAANPPAESPTYRAIRLKLAAAGGLYGGFVEVFLATQIAAVLVASGVLVSTVFLTLTPTQTLVATGFSVALMAWPYSKVWEAEKKRSALINSSLPEFAELLLMPLSSGYSVLPALDFTAQRLEGPVSDEVLRLLDTIRSRALDEEKAFEEAGDHLGTSAAKSFFAVLAQAYLEGVQVIETVHGQAVQLRKTEYERLRERIGKMENTIAVYTGIHLLPGLFLVILFPALLTIGNVA